jgi:hypothetical protein
MKKFAVVLAIVLLASSTMSIAQEREWVLDAAEEDVFLLFGVPNTTDVGVSFWCKIGSGNVSLFAPAPPDKTSLEKVALGIGTSTYQLQATLSESEKQNSFEAKLQPQDQIIAELQAVEHFSLSLGNHKSIFPLNGADFPGLLKFCNNKPEANNN